MLCITVHRDGTERAATKYAWPLHVVLVRKLLPAESKSRHILYRVCLQADRTVDTSDISGLDFLHLLLQLGAGCQRTFVIAVKNVTACSLLVKWRLISAAQGGPWVQATGC